VNVLESTALPFKQKFSPNLKKYSEIYEESVKDPEKFWDKEARKLEWFRTWDKVLEWDPPFARWFIGGLLNASHLCLDRHVKTWRRSKVAIYWEDEVGNTRTLSYSQLYSEVNRLASILRKFRVGKGDRVAVYLPLIPALPMTMLATARIGAIHTVVFSGFSSQALADRVNDTQAKVLITADGSFRRGKLIPLKKIVDVAIEKCPSVESVIVVKRANVDVNMKEGRDFWYHELIKSSRDYVEPLPVESNDPLYILYTSGTTGRPKGIVHNTGAYMVYNHSAYQWAFNIRDESVYWCTADIGWVTGHSSIVYAPLSHAATIVLYEGAPDFPTPDRWWEIIEKYGVTIFYTSPTAIRMLMGYGEKWLKKHDLSSLEILGSVGEPINPEAWIWYYKNVGGERCPIVDTWWQTETGGFMISPAPGLVLVPLKPGSATLPLPSIEAEVVDESGKPAPTGVKGYLVLKKPWPGMLMTLYQDPQRYKEVYWSRFPNVYYTGDYAIRDADGYFWLLGRADEVLKIAGHRIGTMEIESALVSHPAVSEAATIGKPHEVKGESISIFAILKQGYEPTEELKQELKKHVREVIGPVATPEEIYFVHSLPKTRSGKIMRRVLKAVLMDMPIGDLSTLEDEASVEEVKNAYEEFKKLLKGGS
jgi:acetyl-CoA synthetase